MSQESLPFTFWLKVHYLACFVRLFTRYEVRNLNKATIQSIYSGKMFPAKRTSVSQTKRSFLATRKLTYIELCEAFTFLKENIYVQFEGMVYQQIVGIHMGTTCAPLIADWFLFCYERDFMSYLHKSKRYDFIDILTTTLDILTIYSPSITLNLRNIFLIWCLHFSVG